MNRLDAFTVAAMPEYMRLDTYGRGVGITVQEAAASCVAVAQTVMAAVDKVGTPAEVVEPEIDESTGAAIVNPEVLDRPVAFLNLGMRASNTLEKLEVKTLGELTKITRKELGGVHGAGEGTINEIVAKMRKLELHLMANLHPVSGTLGMVKGMVS